METAFDLMLACLRLQREAAICINAGRAAAPRRQLAGAGGLQPDPARRQPSRGSGAPRSAQASNASKACSSSTGTPRLSALVNLLPASAPATT